MFEYGVITGYNSDDKKNEIAHVNTPTSYPFSPMNLSFSRVLDKHPIRLIRFCSGKLNHSRDRLSSVKHSGWIVESYHQVLDTHWDICCVLLFEYLFSSKVKDIIRCFLFLVSDLLQSIHKTTYIAMRFITAPNRAGGIVVSFWLPTLEVGGSIPVSASPREVR